MTKFVFAAAIAATSAIATPALAQSDAGSGFYASLRTGVAVMADPKLDISGTIAGGGEGEGEMSALAVADDIDVTVGTKLEMKSAWALGGEIGYKFGGLRVGLEVGYSRHDVKGVKFRSVNGVAVTPADVADAADLLAYNGADLDGVEIDGTSVRAESGEIAKLRQIAVMGNASYDFALNDTFKPYVGIGLGGVGTELKVLGESNGMFRFAWQARGGVAFAVSPNFEITADYTYRQISKGKFNFSDLEDVDLRLGKTKVSLIQAGVRFTF